MDIVQSVYSYSWHSCGCEQPPLVANRIEDLIIDLAAPEGFPEEAVRLAMVDRDLACAVSREILRRAVRAAEANEPDDLEGASLFALVLLGYHEDEASAQMLRELLGLPAAVRDAMLGDCFFEYMGPVLWAVSAEDASPLLSLVRRGELDPFALAQVIRALVIGVSERQVERLSVIPVLADRLSRILAGPEDRRDCDAVRFAEILAEAIVELSVDKDHYEYLARVERVLDRGMFREPSSLPDWREHLAPTEEDLFERLAVCEGETYPPNPLALRAWAAFAETSRMPDLELPLEPYGPKRLAFYWSLYNEELIENFTVHFDGEYVGTVPEIVAGEGGTTLSLPDGSELHLEIVWKVFLCWGDSQLLLLRNGKPLPDSDATILLEKVLIVFFLVLAIGLLAEVAGAFL